MKYFLLIFLFFAGLNLNAVELDDYKSSCKLIGYEPGTIDFGECVLTLRKKNKDFGLTGNYEQTLDEVEILLNEAPYESPSANSYSNTYENQQGDGSEESIICQRYGFKVEQQAYKQCLVDLNIAKQQADAQKAIHEAQMQQYYQQKRIYEAQVVEMKRKKNSEDFKNVLNFGLGLAGGKTLGQAAPALIGRPMLPNTPRPVIQPVYIQQPSGNRNYQCRYDPWRKVYNCN